MATDQAQVVTETHDDLLLVRLNRPQARNAVDGPTAELLADVFREFEADDGLRVAILTGNGAHFCAGADLKAVSEGTGANRLSPEGDGPMGPSRMRLSKPVIAAVSGYCVAGGLELAAWCDMRVADETAVFGVLCRRFGVPLIDGGTVRLPRLIGQSHAMDMILTGRPVEADEALRMGLANRVVAEGQAVDEATALARQLAAFPQACLRGDRLSVLEQWQLPESEALTNEFSHGQSTLSSGETVSGAGRFKSGQGRHGAFE